MLRLAVKDMLFFIPRAGSSLIFNFFEGGGRSVCSDFFQQHIWFRTVGSCGPTHISFMIGNYLLFHIIHNHLEGIYCMVTETTPRRCPITYNTEHRYPVYISLYHGCLNRTLRWRLIHLPLCSGLLIGDIAHYPEFL